MKKLINLLIAIAFASTASAQNWLNQESVILSLTANPGNDLVYIKQLNEHRFQVNFCYEKDDKSTCEVVGASEGYDRRLIAEKVAEVGSTHFYYDTVNVIGQGFIGALAGAVASTIELPKLRHYKPIAVAISAIAGYATPKVIGDIKRYNDLEEVRKLMAAENEGVREIQIDDGDLVQFTTDLVIRLDYLTNASLPGYQD